MDEEMTEKELRAADEEGDAIAARRLGLLLEERGEIDEAEAAYSRGADRGDIYAAFRIGLVREVHREDAEAAFAAYQRADDMGSVHGAGTVGQILKERGDMLGAEAAFKRCADRGSARGLSEYAGLLSLRRDATFNEIKEACVRLCKAEDSWFRNKDDLDGSLPVLVFSGLWERCDPAAMEAGAREADADRSATGAYHLGMLQAGRGENVDAAATSLRAAERGYDAAWANAATLFHQLGDLHAAENAARRGEEAGEASASTALGLILYQKGDASGELEAYTRADERGHGGGSFRLGIELMQGGDLRGAQAALARAVERGGVGTEQATDALEHVRSRL